MVLDPHFSQSFSDEGYCVLEKAIPESALEALDASCQGYLEEHIGLMTQVQADVLGLTHKDRRYFLPSWHDPAGEVGQFLFGDLMTEIVGRLLGPEAYLFLELFVVKSGRIGMPFGWHQDSGYLLGQAHEPYLSLWCALDDATEENGALHVLPWSKTGSREILPHHKDKASGDFIGYEGDDPGVVVPVGRGGIVAMSSALFHRSGPNTTPQPRRAFLVSYSALPILNPQGGEWNRAVPFLRDGGRVRGGRRFETCPAAPTFERDAEWKW